MGEMSVSMYVLLNETQPCWGYLSIKNRHIQYHKLF